MGNHGKSKGEKTQLPNAIPNPYVFMALLIYFFWGGFLWHWWGGGGGRPFRFPWKGMILGKNPRRVTSPGWMCSSKMRLEAFEV